MTRKWHDYAERVEKSYHYDNFSFGTATDTHITKMRNRWKMLMNLVYFISVTKISRCWSFVRRLHRFFNIPESLGWFVHVSIDNDRKFDEKKIIYLICVILPKISHEERAPVVVPVAWSKTSNKMMQRKIMRLLQTDWMNLFGEKLWLIVVAFGRKMSIGGTIHRSLLFANMKLDSMLHFSL